MKKTFKKTPRIQFRIYLSLVICLCFFSCAAFAQRQIIVDLSPIDGVEITPDNIFNYRILNNGSRSIDVEVKGSLRYKNSPLQFSYTFPARITTGLNIISKEKAIGANWKFSDNALRELFFNYKKLPQGTYEYCVTLDFKALNAENYSEEPIDGCIYQSVNDIFLINLIDPEDDARIYETNPMLTWTVNHPIVSQLTYKLRIAELKKGQNNINAISRNNPVYQQSGIFAMNLLYPITAKPLQKFQPYVWTVDAYYKNILLGGAEVWRFTIVEDTLLKEAKGNQSYYEFQSHIGDTRLNIVGEIKLKYRADGPNDSLMLKIKNEGGGEIPFNDNLISLTNGYNWITIKFYEKVNLKHSGKYELHVTNSAGKNFIIPFTYNNPLFIK